MRTGVCCSCKSFRDLKIFLVVDFVRAILEHMEKQELAYQNSERWNMLLEEGKLLITKGADEIYLIEELTQKDSERLYNAYKSGTIHVLQRAPVNEILLSVISKLDRAGVIYKKVEDIVTTTPLSFDVRWVGVRHERIERLLNFFTKNAKHLALSLDRTPPDLLIIVRTSGRLAQVMEDYEKITSPHLFVDIAYDHTLSLGPLVFVGETACLGCFLGRVTRNWGDAGRQRFQT